MFAQLISDTAPLGAIIRYSDGTPRPPERHRRKLQAWERHNNTGRLVKKQAATVVGQTTIPASFHASRGGLRQQGRHHTSGLQDLLDR